MAAPVPTLSSSGWLTEVSEKADRLMAYYFANEYSQSYIYRGHVVSLPYHIRQHGGHPQRLENRVQKDLTDYLNRYFDSVQVEISANAFEDNENKIDLKIDAIIVQDGERYSLGRTVKSESNKVVDVINHNNG